MAIKPMATGPLPFLDTAAYNTQHCDYAKPSRSVSPALPRGFII
jgi:hypothetical protein